MARSEPTPHETDSETGAAVAHGHAPESFPRTGIGWAIGFRNPLVRLEYLGWRRRPWRNGLVALGFLALIAFVFLARHGTPSNPGYGNFLRFFVPANPFATPRAQFWLGYWGTIAMNFEAGVLRLTTILPWLLVLRSVWRIRRGRLWEPLRLTALTSRDWVAGLAGPPVVLGTLALAIFLLAVVWPSFLLRYPDLPGMTGNPYRTAVIAAIPFIGFEGCWNGFLVAALTLREALRTRRLAMLVLRTLSWILVLQLVHAFAMYYLHRIIPGMGLRWPMGLYTFLLYAVPLSILGTFKAAAGIILFKVIARRLHGYMQREIEDAAH